MEIKITDEIIAVVFIAFALICLLGVIFSIFGCNETLPSDGWYESTCSECETALTEALDELDSSVPAEQLEVSTQRIVEVIETDTEIVAELESWRNEVVRIGNELEARSLQLNGCTEKWTRAKNDLFVACYSMCKINNDCDCYVRHFGELDTDRNIPYQGGEK